MAMTNLKMEFYKQGVVFQWTWRNQEEYRAAKAFLEKFLGYPASAVGEVDFFVSRTRSIRCAPRVSARAGGGQTGLTPSSDVWLRILYRREMLNGLGGDPRADRGACDQRPRASAHRRQRAGAHLATSGAAIWSGVPVLRDPYSSELYVPSYTTRRAERHLGPSDDECSGASGQLFDVD
jgi:hypothetical protein